MQMFSKIVTLRNEQNMSFRDISNFWKNSTDSILKESALMYDLANTLAHIDTYLTNMSKKYKKLRTLM